MKLLDGVLLKSAIWLASSGYRALEDLEITCELPQVAAACWTHERMNQVIVIAHLLIVLEQQPNQICLIGAVSLYRQFTDSA